MFHPVSPSPGPNTKFTPDAPPLTGLDESRGSPTQGEWGTQTGEREFGSLLVVDSLYPTPLDPRGRGFGRVH